MSVLEAEPKTIQESSALNIERKGVSFPKPKIIDLDWRGWPPLRRACGLTAIGMFVWAGHSSIKYHPGEVTYVYETTTPGPTSTATILPDMTPIPFEKAVQIISIGGTPVPRPPKQEVVFDDGRTQIIITTYPK